LNRRPSGLGLGPRPSFGGELWWVVAHFIGQISQIGFWGAKIYVAYIYIAMPRV